MKKKLFKRPPHAVPNNDQPSSTSRRLLLGLGLSTSLLVALILVLRQGGVLTSDFKLNEDIVQDAQRVLEENILSKINQSIPLAYWKEAEKRPGYHLAQQGAKAHFPVVLLPGFVTSGLEVWGGQDCARKHFRQRVWTAFSMAQGFLADRECWGQHMKLDPITGMDPDGIRLRAAAGFEAADYFMANYWVFGRIVENLADVGYTPSTMTMQPFDWRLSFPLMEERDGFFTKLKSNIEDLHEVTGKKVVLTSHSMGAMVTHYFFTWVTTPKRQGGGGGGKDWVDKHIHSYVNIAGCHLGVPKAVSALLSGEMSDIVMLGGLVEMVERVFGRRMRRDLFNTWGSLWSMLPKGGDAIWGTGADMCKNRTDDDPLCPKDKPSPLISSLNSTEHELFNETDDDALNSVLAEFSAKTEHSLEEVLDFLSKYGGGVGPELSGPKENSLFGHEKPSKKTWMDASRTPLPHAPNMKIYCLYGHGVDTERAYYYKRNDPSMNNTDVSFVLNSTVHFEDRNVKYGVRFVDGDVSVPLVSLGYLCADAWTRKSSGLNPSGIPVYTREYKHRFEFDVGDPMRGGPHSADHVDILGNVDVLQDLVRVVTNFDVEQVRENRITSDILSIADEINKKGGIFKKGLFSKK